MMISQDVENFTFMSDFEWLFLFQNFFQRYKVKMLSFNFLIYNVLIFFRLKDNHRLFVSQLLL